MTWRPFENAPKDGAELWAPDGVLLGVGKHHIDVEPETKLCTKKWKAFCEEVEKPFKVTFTAQGLFPEGFDYLENCRRKAAAWDAAKGRAPKFEYVPNPEAGKVTEYDSAYAVYAYDGKSDVQDYEGPVFFTPTHWMPLPPPPTGDA